MGSVNRDSDDDLFTGGLFVEEDEAKAPEYPTETLIIERAALQNEGKTWNSDERTLSLPLYDRFDTPPLGNDDSSSSSVLRMNPGSFSISYRNKRHSLWGHKLWNAAKYLVKRIDQQRIQVRGKTVLELGAGLGVPSLAAYHNGAALVVVTDYPDTDLLDIIQLNVDKNCFQSESDASALPHGSTSICSTSSGTITTATRTNNSRNNNNNGRIIVEPLLWGNSQHIEKVLSYTNGKGFDIIILSDILFNHVCNDDLASTVAIMLGRRSARTGTDSPSSPLGPPVAYCVFSHHRAHKQVDDLEFFDKIISKGLFYEMIDQEDYPMMFPEDRGPIEVRQPVKVYRITRQPPASLYLPLRKDGEEREPIGSVTSFFSSSSPLMRGIESKALSEKEAVVDVVIQGTSLPQCLLSAALAKCGLRVFHCDAAGYYGGAYSSLPFTDFLALLTNDTFAHSFSSRAHAPPKIVINRLSTVGAGRECKKGKSSPSLFGCKAWMTAFGGVMVDLLPISHMARGEMVQQIIDSSFSDLMEFVFVDRLLLLKEDNSNNSGKQPAAHQDQHQDHASFSSSSVLAYDFPLTRGGIFSASNSLLSLMDKRRIMQLVKEMNPVLAEEHHAVNAPQGDEEIMEVEPKARQQWVEYFVQKANMFYDHQHVPNSKKKGEKEGRNTDGEVEKNRHSEEVLTFRSIIKDKFRLGGTSLDIGSVFGFFDHCIPRGVPSTSLEDSVLEEDKIPSSCSSSFPSNSWYRSSILLHQLMTSPDRFGAPTPFIQVKYGIGDLSGAMTRVAATYKALFALDRSVQRVVVREVGGEEKIFAVMSNNGQHVETKVVVLPEGPSGRVPVRFHDVEHLFAVEEARQKGVLSSFDLYVPDRGGDDDDMAGSHHKCPPASFSRVVLLLTSPLFKNSNLPRTVNPQKRQEEQETTKECKDTDRKEENGNGAAAEGPSSSASETHADPASLSDVKNATPDEDLRGEEVRGDEKFRVEGDIPRAVVAMGRFGGFHSSPKGPSTCASLDAAAVHIAQLSKTTGHIPLHLSSGISYCVGNAQEQEQQRKLVDPSSLVLLHFTAKEVEITAEDLYENVVKQYFLEDRSAASASASDTSFAFPTPLAKDSSSVFTSCSSSEFSRIGRIKEEDVLLAAYFTVNEDKLNRFSAPSTFMGDVPSETRYAHESTRKEKLKEYYATRRQQELLLLNSSKNKETPVEKRSAAIYEERKEKAKEISSKCLVACPTMSDSLMDDGAPLLYAKKAFHDVLDKLSIPAEKRFSIKRNEKGGEKNNYCPGYQFL